MSYGMHDYLAEKAMQRQHAMRKLAFAGRGEDLSESPKRKGDVLSLLTAPFDLMKAADRYNKLDVQNPIKPGTVRGKLRPDKTNPAPEKKLRDVILEQVMANKYAIGGAVGAGGAGATVGALSSKENRLRNALIGGGIGTVLGGVAGHIADRYVQ